MKRLDLQKPEGVLLLGGSGVRVSEVTRGGNKHLLEIDGKSLAEHAVNFLARSGVERIVVVTPPHDEARFRAVLDGDRARAPVALSYVHQAEPCGTAHALRCARPELRRAEVVLMFGDNLFGIAQRTVSTPLDDGQDGRIHVATSSTPQHFGVVEIDDAGTIQDIKCKPIQTTSRSVCVGLMKFRVQVLDALDTLIPNARGEIDVMDLVRSLWRAGRLGWLPVEGDWSDVAVSPETLRAARRPTNP